MKYLMMNIDAPLQSWRVKSLHVRRITHKTPTKSAIIGIIASSLGYDRSNLDDILEVNKCSFTVYVIKEGVLMSDFHNTGSGYDKTETNRMVKTQGLLDSDGIKKDTTYNNVISKREYLQDAEFIVVIGSEDEKIMKYEKSLNNPKNFLFFGSKSCPPTSKIVYGVYDDLKDIENHLVKKYNKRIKKMYESNIEDFDYILNDDIVNLIKKEYKNRYIKNTYIGE